VAIRKFLTIQAEGVRRQAYDEPGNIGRLNYLVSRKASDVSYVPLTVLLEDYMFRLVEAGTDALEPKEYCNLWLDAEMMGVYVQCLQQIKKFAEIQLFYWAHSHPQ